MLRFKQVNSSYFLSSPGSNPPTGLGGVSWSTCGHAVPNLVKSELLVPESELGISVSRTDCLKRPGTTANGIERNATTENEGDAGEIRPVKLPRLGWWKTYDSIPIFKKAESRAVLFIW